jgi:predicted GTPase
MSAGKFVKSSYEEDNGTIHPIKVQPETISASLGGAPNTVPSATGAGVVKSKISAKVSKTNKEIGLRPRMVAITYPPVDGSQPDGYDVGATLRIPVLNKETWDALSEGDPATYLGKSGTISSTIPESIK